MFKKGAYVFPLFLAGPGPGGPGGSGPGSGPGQGPPVSPVSPVPVLLFLLLSAPNRQLSEKYISG